MKITIHYAPHIKVREVTKCIECPFCRFEGGMSDALHYCGEAESRPELQAKRPRGQPHVLIIGPHDGTIDKDCPFGGTGEHWVQR